VRPLGIEVSLIEPGPIRTQFTSSLLASASKYGAADSPYRQVVMRSEGEGTTVRARVRISRPAGGPA
jgi:hypothetical protein